jgi:hypothetical protein
MEGQDYEAPTRSEYASSSYDKVVKAIEFIVDCNS